MMPLKQNRKLGGIAGLYQSHQIAVSLLFQPASLRNTADLRKGYSKRNGRFQTQLECGQETMRDVGAVLRVIFLLFRRV
jgi:hypothetical protein